MNILEFYKDPDEIQALIKPAEEGNIEAQYKLGKYYDRKSVLAKVFFKKSIYWYRKAAEKNHIEAQHDLAQAYMYAFYVKERNYKKAFYWF